MCAFEEITGGKTVESGETASEIGGVIESECAGYGFDGVANFGEEELLGAHHTSLINIIRQGKSEGCLETVAKA